MHSFYYLVKIFKKMLKCFLGMYKLWPLFDFHSEFSFPSSFEFSEGQTQEYLLLLIGIEKPAGGKVE